MFDKEVFRKEINDTLTQIGLNTPFATNLLMGTCAQESAFGKYNRQLGGGPALGVFQMEPATFEDIVNNYLYYKRNLYVRILSVCKLNYFEAEEMIDNVKFATCMARVHYLRVHESIPSDLDGWARYWKKYYNTIKGKGTEEEFKENFKKHCI